VLWSRRLVIAIGAVAIFGGGLYLGIRVERRHAAISPKIVLTRGQENRAQKLGEALQHADPQVRRRAAYDLGQLKDSSVISLLITAMKDTGQDREVRWRAAEALGNWRDPKAVEALVMVLPNDGEFDADYDLRREAAIALGRISDPRAVEPLIAALKTDNDGNIRRAAAYALGHINDRRGAESLLNAVRADTDSTVITAASKAYESIAGTSALGIVIGELEEALKSTSFWRRERAAERLADIATDFGTDAAVRLLRQARHERNLEIIAAAHRFFIAKREMDSEEVLLATLRSRFGTPALAVGLVNSGNEGLRKAGLEWARERGLIIVHGY
jgi:HEAT repeat protein